MFSVTFIFEKTPSRFRSSGTMTNQIAVKLHTGPQKEVICHKYSHIYLYEAGGIMANAHASVKLLEGVYGKITAQDVADNISPDDVHACETSLVSLENTMNKGGGSIYTISKNLKDKKSTRDNGIKDSINISDLRQKIEKIEEFRSF